MNDPRFEEGTVADFGNVRLTLGKTDREKNNKWRLYMEIRIKKEDGIKDDLKRGVAVAEYNAELTLEEVHEKVANYFIKFVAGILDSIVVQ